MTTKRYSVVLTELGVAELTPIIRTALRKKNGVTYLLCTQVNPAGPYFSMRVEDKFDDATTIELEFQVQHAYIRGVFAAADLKLLGFTA